MKHKPCKALDEVFFSLCKVIDSPISLGQYLRYKHRSYEQLVNCDINPDDYLAADSFRDDYLAVKFLSKYADLPTGIDLRGVALQNFKDSEEACKRVNSRFRFGMPHGTFEPLIFKVQRKIADILGPLPRLDVIYSLAKWGPGATFDLSRVNASRCLKQSVIPSVTVGALPIARAMVSGDLHWFHAVTGMFPEGPFSVTDSFFSVVSGNRIVTVPKNAKTDRTIAAEPTMNGFIQQGIGRFMRGRLKRSGIDLNNQEINKAWASLAHDLDLCTLDLSAASDSIARNFVSEVLPYEWFDLLDRVRSHTYSVEGDIGVYEKFSSMGNAYTFELESLIFYAITVSVCELSGIPPVCCSVYGDDIVSYRSCSPQLVEALEYCGFKVNTSKSYTSGSFYESCGGHYFDGFDVTPAFQKHLLEGPELVRCHNRLVRHALRRFSGIGVDSRLWRVCLSIRRLSSAYRDSRTKRRLDQHFIPANDDGDDGFLRFAFEQDACGAFVPGRGYHCTVFKFRRVKFTRQELGELAHHMRSCDSKDTNSLWELIPIRLLGFAEVRIGTFTGADQVRLGNSVRLGLKRWVIPSGYYYSILI